MNTRLHSHGSGLLSSAGLVSCGPPQPRQLPDLYVENIQFVNGVWDGATKSVGFDIRNTGSMS